MKSGKIESVFQLMKDPYNKKINFDKRKMLEYKTVVILECFYAEEIAVLNRYEGRENKKKIKK